MTLLGAGGLLGTAVWLDTAVQRSNTVGKPVVVAAAQNVTGGSLYAIAAITARGEAGRGGCVVFVDLVVAIGEAVLLS